MTAPNGASNMLRRRACTGGGPLGVEEVRSFREQDRVNPHGLFYLQTLQFAKQRVDDELVAVGRLVLVEAAAGAPFAHPAAAAGLRLPGAEGRDGREALGVEAVADVAVVLALVLVEPVAEVVAAAGR